MDNKKTGTVSQHGARIVSVSQNDEGPDRVQRLSTGHYAILHPVSPLLIQEVQKGVERPKVPIVYNEEKGREEPNPNHPDYHDAMKEYQEEVGRVAMMAIVMMGMTLVNEDGEPLDIQPGTWLKNLKFLERRTALDLSDYDLEDKYDLEFLYKILIATGAKDIEKIAQSSNIQEEDIAESVESFRG